MISERGLRRGQEMSGRKKIRTDEKKKEEPKVEESGPGADKKAEKIDPEKFRKLFDKTKEKAQKMKKILPKYRHKGGE